MDTKTFAQKIKAKYPAYQNIDDATLVNKIIEKYPEYKSQVNVQSETSQDISQTGSAIANTVNQGVDKYSQIQARQDAGLQGGLRTKLQQLGVGAGTASGVINDVLTGAVKTVLPQSAENAVKSGVQTVTKPIIESAPVQSIMSKYEELKQTNPKLAQDISSALGFAQLGLDVTGIGETAGLAKTGIKKGVQLAETGVKDIAQAGSELAKGVEKLGTAITPKPEEIMNRVARLTPSDARKFEALAGKSHGQYLKETGNFGTPDEIVKREAEKFVQSMNEADNALASLPGEYKSPSIDVAASELVDKAKRVSAPGIDSPILARATELQNKANTTGLTMSEVNELKRLYEKNVKLGYNKLMNADAVERATNIDNALRNWQFGKAKELGFSNLDELNKQTQLSKFMVDKLGNQILGKSGNNAMGLTDWIMVSGGDPTAIGGLLVKKFFSSEKVQSRIAKMLTKEAPSELKTATINKPINNIGSYITGTTRSKPSQQLLEGKQLKKALPTVSKKNGIMSSDLSTGVKKAYNNAKDTLKTLKDKNVRERGSISLESILPERKPKGNQGVSLAKNTTEDLIQQAKKYKSAEEFVKAKTNALHGSDVEIKEFSKNFLGKNTESKGSKDTFFFTSSKEMADEYGRGAFLKKKVGELGDITPEQRPQLLSEAKGKAKINEVLLEYKNPKIIKLRGILKDNQVVKDIQRAKEQGYDAIVYKDVIDPILGDSEKFIRGDITAIFDSSVIKTKSQLTDIWNKANKNVEIEPLLQEAKKYKSAEEFVKAKYNVKNTVIPSNGKLKYKMKDIYTNEELYKKYPILEGTNIRFSNRRDAVLNGANGLAIGNDIVIADDLIKKTPDVRAVRKLEKRLKVFLDKELDGTLTETEYKTAAEIQDEISNIINKPGATVELTDDALRVLAHEIQHLKQSVGGKGVKRIKETDILNDFAKENPQLDMSEYYGNPAELEARMSENKIKTKSQLEDIWKKANKK